MKKRKTVLCGMCCKEHPDKYEARLCCDERGPAETETEQFKRLFPEEFVGLGTDKMDAAGVAKHIPPGSTFILNHFKYQKSTFEVIMLSKTQISVVDTRAPRPTCKCCVPRIDAFAYSEMDAWIRYGKIVITPPPKDWDLPPEFQYIYKNFDRIEKEDGVRPRLNYYG